MNKPPLDFTRVDNLIEQSFDSMARDLMELLKFASVEGEAAPGAPFGPEVAGALGCGLDLCRRLGLEAHDLDGFCGYADLKGETQRQVGVLAHLDVVPAVAEEWDYPPFAPVMVGDEIYGRGTLDDKGPLLAALYGLKALKEAGFVPGSTVRVIMGCNEETGMACMEHYLSKFPAPDCGFTPDAEWPLIIGEKGVMHYTLSRTWSPAATPGPQLLSLNSGTAANVVPAKAEAVFSGLTLSSPLPQGVSARQEGERTVITASGTAAHASTPEDGDNALSKLLRFLDSLSFAPSGAREFIASITALNRDDCCGRDMGVAGEDELSQLSHCPTLCSLDQTGGVLTCDMRFLLTRHGDHYISILEHIAAKHQLKLEVLHCQDPLWLGKDHPMIQGLLNAYREVTGDMTEPLIIGGGTYAKMFPNFLAFGPEPHDAPALAHQANERISKAQLLQAAKIYARAIYSLAK